MKWFPRIAAIGLSLSFVPAVNAVSHPAAVAASSTPSANAAMGDGARYLDSPDLKAMLPRFLTKQGFLDPAFSAAVEKPSPYYSDFYGAQALANITKEEVKRDFVPRYASVEGEDDHSITLQFKARYTGRFYPHSALVIKGMQFPFDHVYISGATWRELLNNLESFIGMIEANGWQSRYLVPNPEYNAELAVAASIAKPGAVPTLTVDPDLKAFDPSDNAVLISPEGVHGIPSTGFDTLYPLLKTHNFNWLGMEMLPSSMQSELDAFTLGKEGSPGYLAARKAMVEYFRNAWNGQSGAPKTSGEDNYYFKLLDAMRVKHERVVGLEGASLMYDAFRYGESGFGAAVRSYLWAQNVPMHGRGVVYGGSAHFTSSRPVNFQNFLERRNPTVKFFLLKPLHVSRDK